MNFLYPIAFLALAGLTIPLIIHLWNVKQGKTLKIGSLSLLGETAKASSKSLKINEVLLFVLRCLLIILIALFLAQPYLEKTMSAKSKGGWVVIPHTQLKEALAKYQKPIDSLLTAGFELHDFSLGFPLLSVKDSIKLEDTTVNQKLSYTSLLQSLNELVPANYTVHVFADRRLNQLNDNLPTVSYQLHWSPVSLSDTLSNWISAYAGRKYEAFSTPSSTNYRILDHVSSPPLRVKIYDDKATVDRQYLTAAIKAIADFDKRELVINPNTGQVDIGFWLSELPVTSTFKQSIQKNGSLFQYANGKVVSAKSTLNVNGKLIKLYKRIETSRPAEEIWQDGLGQPILSKSVIDNIRTYKFHSRLNPRWSDLVWDETFVEAIMPIVTANGPSNEFGFEDHAGDQRTISVNEKVSDFKKTQVFQTQPGKNKVIVFPFWIAAFVILLIERVLSFKQKRYAGS